MAEHRPFPPSARRLALARRAGLHAASPLVTGALTCGAALLAAVALAPATAAQLGAWIEAACRVPGAPLAAAAPGPGLSTDAPTALTLAGLATNSPGAALSLAGLVTNSPGAVLAPAGVPHAVLSLALPILAAAATAAAIAHLAQTRAPWLPRRRIPGAPAVASGPAERTRRGGFELAAAAALGATAFGWLWSSAPRLAALSSAPLAGGALLAGAVATLATVWALLGALDALLRHLQLAQALRMSPHDKREDDRLSGLDPRWRAYRARAARAAPLTSLAGATVLVLGDDTAVAVAWDAARRPIPTRTATGRGARATQLLGLARRHRIPVHRDAALAATLAATDGPIPEPHWPRLAEVIAAVRRS
jgi:type III secretion system FlhB-like substrate exporter